MALMCTLVVAAALTLLQLFTQLLQLLLLLLLLGLCMCMAGLLW
jgi:hypothetical protein